MRQGLLQEEEMSEAKEYTSAQLYRMGVVYDMMARLLPTEGRDYSVKFEFGEGGSMSVSFKAYTDIGRVWCDYCREALRSAGERMKR